MHVQYVQSCTELHVVYTFMLCTLPTAHAFYISFISESKVSIGLWDPEDPRLYSVPSIAYIGILSVAVQHSLLSTLAWSYIYTAHPFLTASISVLHSHR